MDAKNIYALFATDAKKEQTGRWCGIGNSEFLLARAGGSNTKFTSAYAAAMRPFQRQQAIGAFTEEQAREVLVGPFVKHVLLGWRTRLFDENGKFTGKYDEGILLGKDNEKITYTAEAAKALMLDIPDLLMTLVETSNSFVNYTPEDAEEAAKN